MHYNRWLGLGTAVTNPIKGKSLPERWWFKLAIKRDDNMQKSDVFWITGLISNMDNFSNKRIKEYVKVGRMVMVEGVIQQWENKQHKTYIIILAKLLRVEVFNKKRYQNRLLTKTLK